MKKLLCGSPGVGPLICRSPDLGAGTATPRILVVDDDMAVRSAIDAVLSHEGYEVVVADGGPNGLKALTASRFDAVLVDIFMPGMDGLETIRSFQGAAPGVPMVAMSGFLSRDAMASAPDFLGMATKLGAAYSLQKPFRPKELIRVVQACLSGNPTPTGDGSPQSSVA